MRRLSLEALERHGPAALAPVDPAVRDGVASIIDEVRSNGASALAALRARYDRAALAFDSIEVPDAAIDDALRTLDPHLLDALRGMVSRVRRFAEAQLAPLCLPIEVETAPGVICQSRARPIARVACYVPGGRHPLPSSAVMTALTAKVAGVPDVTVLCPDPRPIVLAAARLAGADRILALGGAHGVAAVAFGVAPCPRVDLVCGPGGVWVAEAKRQLAGQVGVDLPAGPSEVLVLADESARLDLVIADLEAQAEHDPAARPLLATTSEALAQAVEAHVARGFAGRANEEALAGAFARGGAIVLCASRAELARAADALAPEHLALHVADPEALVDAIDCFGAAFVGEHAGEVLGDYGAGPNHVLPTAGAARFTAGLSVHTFVRHQTLVRVSAAGARGLAEPTARLAEAEGLHAHAAAARLRGAV